MRSHNEERPFKCKWPGCDKGFARQHDCKRHEQLHLNVRPYTCQGCLRTFARMDALNRHCQYFYKKDIFHTNLFYSEIGFWYGLSKSSTYTDYRICCRNASGSCSGREIGFSATRGWSQSEGQVRKGWSYGLAGAERLMLMFSPFIPIVLALLVLVTRVCFDSCLWWLFVSVVCAIS